MTNLRLPGQYDERLLAAVGLQGPYYNWNRWYLPGVGRYLEVDPIALRVPPVPYGEASPSPPWYTYPEDNPLLLVDPFGLDRYKYCKYCEPFKDSCKKVTDAVCSMNVGRGTCCAADRADCDNKAKNSDDVPGQMLKCREQEALCVIIGKWPEPKPLPGAP